MKKIMTLFVITMHVIIVNAQSIGLRAGADFATATAKFDGLNVSENETGFYIGVFKNFKVSENFKFRPEVNYINIEDLDQIQIPVLASVGLNETFDLMAGPSFNFLIDPDEESKTFHLGLDFGISYKLIDQFFIESRYSLGLTNLAEKNDFNASLKLSGLFVGLGYEF